MMAFWGRLGGSPRYSRRGRLGFAEDKTKFPLVLRARPSSRGFGLFPKSLQVKHTLYYSGNSKYKYKVCTKSLEFQG